MLLATAATLLSLSGCSGMSSLMVRNLTAADLAVTVRSNEAQHGDEDEELVSAGEEIETIRWHGWPPDWIEATVKHTSGRTAQRKWLRADYPELMQDGPGLTTYFVLEVSSDGLLLRDPTTWDAIRRNPLGYSLLGLWPVGIVLGVVLAIRRRRVITQ